MFWLAPWFCCGSPSSKTPILSWDYLPGWTPRPICTAPRWSSPPEAVTQCCWLIWETLHCSQNRVASSSALFSRATMSRYYAMAVYRLCTCRCPHLHSQTGCRRSLYSLVLGVCWEVFKIWKDGWGRLNLISISFLTHWKDRLTLTYLGSPLDLLIIL